MVMALNGRYDELKYAPLFYHSSNVIVDVLRSSHVVIELKAAPCGILGKRHAGYCELDQSTRACSSPGALSQVCMHKRYHNKRTDTCEIVLPLCSAFSLMGYCQSRLGLVQESLVNYNLALQLNLTDMSSRALLYDTRQVLISLGEDPAAIRAPEVRSVATLNDFSRARCRAIALFLQSFGSVVAFLLIVHGGERHVSTSVYRILRYTR